MSFVRSIALIAGYLFGAVSIVGQEKLPVSWESDSTLRSVFFVDHDSGWAVGDRGTILKTEDGGRNWQSISTPRDVIWTDVRFINEKVGWIVGGFYSGALDRSIGLMIRTIDGGNSWQNFSRPGIPFIKKIVFEDEQSGWIQCDTNALYPAGLLVTADGGTTWTSPAGATTRKLKIACKVGDRQYAGIDENNECVFFDRAGVLKKGSGTVENPLALVSPKKGHCLCISDGKLVHYQALGSRIESPRANDASELVHINNVYCLENHVWAVGSPGSIVLHSQDFGNTWTHSRTGESEPLNAIFFLNQERGWAVGALGRVLTTKDGGQTWNVQRNQKIQLGVINLASSAKYLSPNGLALLSGSFNHRCGVYLLDAPDIGGSRRLRISQAFNRVGNSGYEFNRTDQKGTLFQLVKSFRTWKPSVLIVDENDQLTRKWIAESVEATANAEQFPELIEYGIRPWKIQKVIAVSDNQELEASVSINQYSAHLGRTVGLQSRFACQLLDSEQWMKSSLSWRSLMSTTSSQNSSQGMTTGTAAYSNPHCRRNADQVQVDNLQQFHSIANWNRSLEQLGRHFVLSPIDEKAWLEQVTAATSGMDNLTIAFFLEDLATTYTFLKKPVMADHTERLILQKSIQSEVGERTLWKMIQRYGSDESNRELNRLVQKRLARANAIESKVKPATANLPFDPVRPSAANATQAAFTEVDVSPASARNANQLIEIFQNRYPDLENHPQYEMVIAWGKYRTGNRSALDRLLDTAGSRNLPAAITRRLNREIQLEQAEGTVVGSIPVAKAHNDRIVLDALLDEISWRTPREDSKQAVRFAIDHEHLYIAGSVKLKTPIEVNPNRRRTRDESLSGFERIKVFIDFDRDYNSGIELSIDTRGACNDAIWRDATTLDYSYDPKWYVASNVNDRTWNFEAAIPLNELPTTELHPQSGWVVSSLRLSPQEKSPRSVNQFIGSERILRLSSPQEQLRIDSPQPTGPR